MARGITWPAALLALAAAAPAPACLPPIGEEPSREERVREAGAAAPNIVYAVVDRARRTRSGELRTVRIIHVYKGGLSPGQRLTMRVSDVTSMCSPRPPASMIAQRGAYGVLLLYRIDGPEAIDFPDFLEPNDVGELIRAGIIQSARNGSR